jgi:hypothetical protein
VLHDTDDRDDDAMTATATPPQCKLKQKNKAMATNKQPRDLYQKFLEE